MPCLVLTGHPCVGKTTFASLLATRALSHKSNAVQTVVIINEESACPDRTKSECYADSSAEKLTRGALKSDFDRHCSEVSPGGTKDKLVVLDSMNYIKGYRYELHCISKASGERHGVIWLLCDADVAKRWNRKRRRSKGEEEDDGYYTEEKMDELALRYEPPDQRNRWDRPLYRVDVTSTLPTPGQALRSADDEYDSAAKAAEDALKRSVYDMHSLGDAINDPVQRPSAPSASSGFRRGHRQKTASKQGNVSVDPSSFAGRPEDGKASASVPTQSVDKSVAVSGVGRRKMEDLIDEILDSFLLDVEPLKEGVSTQKVDSADANVLHDVDSVTQKICNAVTSAQKSSSRMAQGVGGKLSIPVGDDGTIHHTIELHRTIHMPELKRLRRQYVRWVASHPPADSTERGIAVSFLSYIETQL